jgi:hypothetical protein
MTDPEATMTFYIEEITSDDDLVSVHQPPDGRAPLASTLPIVQDPDDHCEPKEEKGVGSESVPAPEDPHQARQKSKKKKKKNSKRGSEASHSQTGVSKSEEATGPSQGTGWRWWSLESGRYHALSAEERSRRPTGRGGAAMAMVSG